MFRRICRERIDFRIASRITFETFVKGYVQSHMQPALAPEKERIIGGAR